MTNAIIPDERDLVNKQMQVVQQAVLNELDEIRAKIDSVVELLQKQDGNRYSMVLSELNWAKDSLEEAYAAAEDEDHTQKIYGLDLADYAKRLAYGVTGKEAA